MPYNIDMFKVKKLEGLKIPEASLFKHVRKDWHPEKELLDVDGSVEYRMCESLGITGILKNGIIEVVDIGISGEGSGTTMSWIIEPALKDSEGELIVSCIWEGGDTVNQLRFKDGAIEWVDLEI